MRPNNDEKVRENRARRAARRRGYELVKAPRSQDPTECWLIVDPGSGKIVSGRLLLQLSEVEEFLGFEGEDTTPKRAPAPLQRPGARPKEHDLEQSSD